MHEHTDAPDPSVPEPAHPRQRKEPLPWQTPKSAEEDPDAQQRLQTILEGTTYLQADEDPGFLRRDDTRGLRLHVDYLKPELLFAEHDVRHTIVVFGSTRIPEPAAAQRRFEAAASACQAAPNDEALARKRDVAARLVDKSRYYEIARELGRLVGRSGAGPEDCTVVIATGGGPGIMEAANRGAFDVGAKSAGLNITLPHEQYPNPYITPELCFRFHYFAMRKLHFLLRARALVFFPGGYGTLDELFETLALIQTRKIEPVPVVLVGEAYWRRAFDVDFLVDEGVIDLEDRDLYWHAESAAEVWEGIGHWHTRAGASRDETPPC